METPYIRNCLCVIPVHNEQDVLSDLICKLKALDHLDIGINMDFLFINDDSEDESEKILIEKHVKYISLINNLGIGGAVQCGYIFAEKYGYDYIVQIDGDGQHPPEELIKLLLTAEEFEEDLIIGSRFISNSSYRPSIARKLGMIYSSWLLKFMAGQKIYDTTSGFRLTKNKLIHFFSNEYPQHEAGLVSLLMAAKAGFRFKEIPIQMNQRQTGKSSINITRALFYPFKTIINSLTTIIRK